MSGVFVFRPYAGIPGSGSKGALVQRFVGSGGKPVPTFPNQQTRSQPVHRRPSDLDRLEELERVGKGAVVQEISAMFELQAGKLSVVCLWRKDGRAWLSTS